MHKFIIKLLFWNWKKIITFLYLFCTYYFIVINKQIGKNIENEKLVLDANNISSINRQIYNKKSKMSLLQTLPSSWINLLTNVFS